MKKIYRFTIGYKHVEEICNFDPINGYHEKYHGFSVDLTEETPFQILHDGAGINWHTCYSAIDFKDDRNYLKFYNLDDELLTAVILLGRFTHNNKDNLIIRGNKRILTINSDLERIPLCPGRISQAIFHNMEQYVYFKIESSECNLNTIALLSAEQKTKDAMNLLLERVETHNRVLQYMKRLKGEK